MWAVRFADFTQEAVTFEIKHDPQSKYCVLRLDNAENELTGTVTTRLQKAATALKSLGVIIE